MHDIFGFEMAASGEKLESYARAPGETVDKFPGNVGIVFRVED